MELKLDLIGFGTVGIGFIKILNRKKDVLKNNHELEIKVVSISDKIKGTLVVEEGIDLMKLEEIINNGGKLSDYGKNYYKFSDKNAINVINETSSDIMVEMTFTNIKTAEPATTHIKEAFLNGKHIVTSNKGPIALFYKELKSIAAKNNLYMGIEGTVLSGTPVFNLVEETLPPNSIKKIRGILNGTTNFILTKMEQDGMSYGDALKKAQELGYAEADPTADVEGFDALAKVTILSNVILGGNLKPDDIPVEGITKITIDDIEKAKKEGYRYKLIGETAIVNGNIRASVKPEKLPLSDPLSGVSGATNALSFETDLMGKITISGAGAGQIETGFSILIDIIRISRKIRGSK